MQPHDILSYTHIHLKHTLKLHPPYQSFIPLHMNITTKYIELKYKLRWDYRNFVLKKNILLSISNKEIENFNYFLIIEHHSRTHFHEEIQPSSFFTFFALGNEGFESFRFAQGWKWKCILIFQQIPSFFSLRFCICFSVNSSKNFCKKTIDGMILFSILEEIGRLCRQSLESSRGIRSSDQVIQQCGTEVLFVFLSLHVIPLLPWLQPQNARKNNLGGLTRAHCNERQQNTCRS